MKQTIYILVFLIVFSGCNDQQTSVDEVQMTAKDTVAKKNENTKHHTKQDTISIITELGDTIKYGKAEYNSIVDQHPEFFDEYPNPPDKAYFNNKGDFESEIGRDDYYLLYAYFLKQRNNLRDVDQERKRLVDIYSTLNSLFAAFEHGGTYFGHQSIRVLGYAEYSVFLIPDTEEDIAKKYSIKKQKELYIKSLRQLIADESSNDGDTPEKEKERKNKELNKLVDELDKFITHIFYLRRAQEFQYTYYEYY